MSVTDGLSTGSTTLPAVNGGDTTIVGVSVATVVSGTRTGMGSTVLTSRKLEGSGRTKAPTRSKIKKERD
jgi:hypothetical protein